MKYQIKEDEMGVHIARMRKKISHKILTGNSEGKTPLGKQRRRWEIILKWVLKK
jgi:hypothetical protein